MFHMLGAFAEFENDIRRERQQDGIAKAQANGVKFGRKPVLSDEQQATIKRLRKNEGFHHCPANGTLPDWSYHGLQGAWKLLKLIVPG